MGRNDSLGTRITLVERYRESESCYRCEKATPLPPPATDAEALARANALQQRWFPAEDDLIQPFNRRAKHDLTTDAGVLIDNIDAAAEEACDHCNEREERKSTADDERVDRLVARILATEYNRGRNPDEVLRGALTAVHELMPRSSLAEHLRNVEKRGFR